MLKNSTRMARLYNNSRLFSVAGEITATTGSQIDGRGSLLELVKNLRIDYTDIKVSKLEPWHNGFIGIP